MDLQPPSYRHSNNIRVRIGYRNQSSLDFSRPEVKPLFEWGSASLCRMYNSQPHLIGMLIRCLVKGECHAHYTLQNPCRKNFVSCDPLLGKNLSLSNMYWYPHFQWQSIQICISRPSSRSTLPCRTYSINMYLFFTCY